MKNQKTSRKSFGFTLIELLVVVAVLGILAALLLANLASARTRAQDSKSKSDLRQLKTALRLYYNDYQRYPAGNGTMVGCGGATPTACPTNGGAFSRSNVTYMAQLPANYSYSQTGGIDTFLVSITLNNASDADIAASKARCGVNNTTSNYYICQD